MQVTWHLLVMFWGIYEIVRTGFARNTCECRLLQLVVTGKWFDQKIFLKKYLIRFDIQWHVLPGIKCITEVWRPFKMFILVCTWFVQFTSLRALFIWTSATSRTLSRLHISYFFWPRSFKEAGSAWWPRRESMFVKQWKEKATVS